MVHTGANTEALAACRTQLEAQLDKLRTLTAGDAGQAPAQGRFNGLGRWGRCRRRSSRWRVLDLHGACGRPRLPACDAGEASAELNLHYLRASIRALISVMMSGTRSNRSPTMPKSAMSKMGASSSLLIATIVSAVCMPTRCCTAPEMPTPT